MPAGLDEYLNYRANKAGSVLANLSEKQKHKMNEKIIDSSDDLAKFEIFDAMCQDVILFGDKAFTITKKIINEEENGA